MSAGFGWWKALAWGGLVQDLSARPCSARILSTCECWARGSPSESPTCLTTPPTAGRSLMLSRHRLLREKPPSFLPLSLALRTSNQANAAFLLGPSCQESPKKSSPPVQGPWASGNMDVWTTGSWSSVAARTPLRRIASPRRPRRRRQKSAAVSISSHASAGSAKVVWRPTLRKRIGSSARPSRGARSWEVRSPLQAFHRIEHDESFAPRSFLRFFAR